MANLALIKGAAMAAPKFTDIRAAVEPGIQTFKNIQDLRQKEIEENKKRLAARNKEYQERAKDAENNYSDFIGTLELGKIKEEAYPSFYKLLNNTKNKFKNSILIDDIFERNESQRNALTDVQNEYNFIVGEQEYSANYIDLDKNEDISDANDFGSQRYKIAKARAKGWKAITEDGKNVIYSIDGKDVSIPKNEIKNYTVIPKESIITRDVSNLLDNEIEKINRLKIFPSSAGWEQKINAIKDKINIKTPEQALSILVDHFKVAGQKGEYADIINAVLEEKNPIIALKTSDGFKYKDINELGEETGEILTGSEGIIEFAKDQFLKNFISAANQLENDAKIKEKPAKETEAAIKRRIAFENAQEKSLDISEFKEELGIPVNKAGIAIGDLENIKSKAKLDITSNNFSNLINRLGFRISGIYRADKEDPNSKIESIELQKQGGGGGVYEILPNQSSIQFLEDIFRMQGVNEADIPKLINNVLYGTYNEPIFDENNNLVGEKKARANNKYSQFIIKEN